MASRYSDAVARANILRRSSPCSLSICGPHGPKKRPAVVVSADPQGTELILAFITSVLSNRSPRGAEVKLQGSDPEFGAMGLKTDALIRLDKLVTLSSSVVSRRLGMAGPITRGKLAAMLRLALDLK